VPALSENRLATSEQGGVEEESRKPGRESGRRRSSDVVRAVVPSTRQGEREEDRG
jgi:hypothetical protein